MTLYNYDRDKSGNPFEKCYIKNDGTMIGSTNCERCKYCIRSGYQNEASGTVGFIECTKNVDARIKPKK
jgi:hypothetical protein